MLSQRYAAERKVCVCWSDAFHAHELHADERGGKLPCHKSLRSHTAMGWLARTSSSEPTRPTCLTLQPAAMTRTNDKRAERPLNLSQLKSFISAQTFKLRFIAHEKIAYSPKQIHKDFRDLLEL